MKLTRGWARALLHEKNPQIGERAYAKAVGE